MRQLEKLMPPGELITQGDLNALLDSLQGALVADGLSDAEADARDQKSVFHLYEAAESKEAAVGFALPSHYSQ
jgi:hypothetical protein